MHQTYDKRIRFGAADFSPKELKKRLVHNKIDSVYLLSKLNFYVPKQSSRRCCTFYLSMLRTNLLAKEPLPVMCSNFNSVSHHCDVNHSCVRERRAIRLIGDQALTCHLQLLSHQRRRAVGDISLF
nr:unnamed protein product [Callosobruchus chinensis]